MKKINYLKLYNYLTWLGTPFIIFYILLKLILGIEKKFSFMNKLGFHNIKFDKTKEYIWVHGNNMGESISVFNIVKELLIENKNLYIIFTGARHRSNKVVSNYFADNERVIHRPLIFEHEFCIKRFLRGWDPKLLIWVETGIPSNIVYIIAKRAKIILLNASLTDISFKKWKYFKNFLSYKLSHIDLILPKTKSDLEKYKFFGVKKMKFIGDIKFTAEIKSNFLEKHLTSQIINKKILVAASTHEPEELYIVKLYSVLKKKYPDLILILAPRLPYKCKKIAKKIDKIGFGTILRSEGYFDPSKIYIIDNLGELTKFYWIADLIFLGNSMGRKGGHNPLEATKLGKMIHVGPYMDNFKELTEELLNIGAIKKIFSWQELEKSFENFLANGSNNMLSEEIMNYIEEKSTKIREEYKKNILKFL